MRLRIEHAPIIPEMDDIIQEYSAQFNEMIQSMSPEELQNLEGWLQEKAGNIDHTLLGSSSMIPRFMEIIHSQFE